MEMQNWLHTLKKSWQLELQLPTLFQRMEPVLHLHGLFLKALLVSAKVHLRRAEAVADVHTG